MLNALSRFAVAIAIIVSVALGFLVYRNREAAEAFKTERAALKASTDTLVTLVQASQVRRMQDSASMSHAIDSIGKLEERIGGTLIINAILRDSAQILREMQLSIPLTPSVPGQAATVGDTLRQCRSQIALCSQRGALETRRADSVSTVLFEATMQLGALRSDVGVWKQSAAMDHSMLEYTERQLLNAQSLLRNAEPRCRGVLVFGCPSRIDAALWSSAVTIFVLSDKKEARAVALALVAGSFVW